MIRQLSVGPIGQNVYIVERRDSPVVIVDPGSEAPRIVQEALAALERSSSDVLYIACTHGHLDHVAALGETLELLRARGLSPRVYAPEGDRAYFGARAEELNRRVFQGIHAMGYLTISGGPYPKLTSTSAKALSCRARAWSLSIRPAIHPAVPAS
jgi:glyoxylase-like metal-dependent hydrolase (beta-lactamase superfamily II)